jgi:hypothetical protein
MPTSFATSAGFAGLGSPCCSSDAGRLGCFACGGDLLQLGEQLDECLHVTP